MGSPPQLADLVAVVRDHLPLADPDLPVDPTCELASLGLDSMGLVEVVVAVEDRFGVAFPEEHLTLETFKTMAAIWGVLISLPAGAPR